MAPNRSFPCTIQVARFSQGGSCSPDGFGQCEELTMNNIVLTIAAIAVSLGVPAAAAHKRTAQTPLYWVTYDPARDTYCIKFYADGQAADPHPGGPGITCRHRDAWAREHVFIHDPARSAP
jgi:hypothetical protein